MELLQHQNSYQIRLHENDEIEEVDSFELLANPCFPFNPDKIYYVKVLSDKYPSVLGKKGTCYKHLGKEIPTYCTKSDIKIIDKEEYLKFLEDEKTTLETCDSEQANDIKEALLKSNPQALSVACNECKKVFNAKDNKEQFEVVLQEGICGDCWLNKEEFEEIRKKNAEEIYNRFGAGQITKEKNEEERVLQPSIIEEEQTDEEKSNEVLNEERNEEEVEEYNEGINWIKDKYWGSYKRIKAKNIKQLKMRTKDSNVFFLAHNQDTITGKPFPIGSIKKPIPLVSEYQSKPKKPKKGEEEGEPGEIYYKFIGDNIDKRSSANPLNSLCMDFFTYKLIDNHKEYFILSEEQLSTESYTFTGMIIPQTDSHE